MKHIAALLALGATCLCGAMPAAAAETGLREEIERSMLSENYSAAEKAAQEYLARPDAPDRRQVEYVRAVCLLKLKKRDEARQILERILPETHDPREKERVQNALIWAAPAQASEPRPLPAPAISRQQLIEEIPRYSIQVGSFSIEKNARSLLHQLGERRYNAFIDQGGDGLYRVKVGPLNSRQGVLDAQARLKKDGYETKLLP